jgi:hypothetical protein
MMLTADYAVGIIRDVLTVRLCPLILVSRTTAVPVLFALVGARGSSTSSKVINTSFRRPSVRRRLS